MQWGGLFLDSYEEMRARSETRKTVGLLVAASIAAALAVLLGHSSFATEAYLPRVGPVPLRFAPIISNRLILPPLAMSDKELNRPSPMPAKTNETTVADIGPLNNAAAQTVIQARSPANTGMDPAGLHPEPIISPGSANDLLNISPQMLVSFFKPNAANTNSYGGSNGSGHPPGPGTEVVVPMEFGFTPPVPKASGSSQATYRSQ
jgi:hypothetical protein